MDKLDATLSIEKIVLPITEDSSEADLKLARRSVRRVFQEFAGVNIDSKKSLADTIGDVYENGKNDSLRVISIYIFRLFSVPNFFPKHSAGSNLDTRIISLVESSVSDFYKRFDIDEKMQTYEKVDKLSGVHSYACDKLSCLNNCPPKIETIAAQKQMILRAVGDSTVKSYLSLYDFSRIRASVEAILTQVIEFSNSADTMFNRKLKDLSDLLADELEYCGQRPTFITINYYRPFLNIVSQTVKEVAEQSKERFACDIKSRKGFKFTLDKKYPLHIEDSDVRLTIPLENIGPGIADRVTVFVSTQSDGVLIYTEEIELGWIGPGEFVVPVSFGVCDPIDSLLLAVTIAWRVVGSSDEKIVDLSVKVEAQRIDIDWSALEIINPYSLDVATGKNFYGRKDKVDRLFSRIVQGGMQSSYISGQRRVGKSSLAKAVEDAVVAYSSDYYVLNIDCGDFKHPDAMATVNSLGGSIEYFLSHHLPRGVVWKSVDMNGSLAMISRLASELKRAEPQKKFLIVIDEFDEINQELYRYGESAETFFLNIRSLSGKSNICFILVGAEKMSFVMSSQGEKLNRFVNISLDSFNQREEWQDYEDLIRGNLVGSIVWHDNSIRRLYATTNGHPYFTKQVCAKAFELAINARDAEISNEEVEVAVEGLVSELDVNAFQHFWRDGIQGELDEIEILALKRCRVLVGIARAMRLGIKATVENITKNIHSKQLPETEILPILTDFCRRKIMIEKEQVYSFVIPLFERWLVNKGFNSLIADQLGDELAEKRQEQEDKAYVQDVEINELVSTWPAYRGLQVTTYSVRDWIAQGGSLIKQRMLFKLLCNLRFFGEAEVREGLKVLHDKIRSRMYVPTTRSKAQRRKDLWVTYVDGPGKSGAQFAALYAEGNLISATCIKEISEIGSILQGKKTMPAGLSTIVIVDDFVGSGDSLSTGITEFYSRNGEAILGSKIAVFLIVVCATAEGEDKVRVSLSELDKNADMVVLETLEARHYAFTEECSIWDDKSEFSAAKELCQRLGVKLDKSRPLGYGGAGLLVVFSRNCPNNTLPIIHSSGRGENTWCPMFERVKH